MRLICGSQIPLCRKCGHTTYAEAERWTEKADQACLAGDATIKLEGNLANGIAQTTLARL